MTITHLRGDAEGELVWLVDRAAGPRPDQSRQAEENREGGQSVSRSGDPSVVVVMGVSGCGKSTIASMLASG
jgi:signal recognition particle GTPase